MLIVLDTNVFHEDFLMRSSRFEILLDYATRTASRFVVPRIVYDELQANYARELRRRYDKLRSARDQLNGIRLKPVPMTLELDINVEVIRYMEDVLKTLEVGAGDLHEYGANYLEDAVRRAIHRRRPCTERGEEIRDALLWQSVVDLAAETRVPVVFVSKNTNQFAGERGQLHAELSHEVESRGLRIEYFPSLEEFAKAHATPIKFITSEWLEANIDADDVFKGAYDAIEDAVEHYRWVRSATNEISAADWTMFGGVEIDEFFVYRMADGTYRVEAIWAGGVDVDREIEYEVDEYEDDWEYAHDPLSGDLERVRVQRPRTRSKTRTKDARFRLLVTTEAVVTNETVASWRIVESRCDPD